MSIIEFSIHVENPDQVAAVFDKIDVVRSPDDDGVPTPFTLLTADQETAAIIDGTVSGPWNISGQSISIILDNAEPVVHTFTGTNPLTLASLKTQLNSLFPRAHSIASEVPTDTNKLRLTSVSTGTQAVLQISGAAAVTLGLSTSRTNGRSARPLLSANTEEYLFRDYDGQSVLWYKTRYVNSATGAVSDFSAPFQAGEGVGLPISTVVTGSVALADITGAPIVNRRIIVVPVSSQVIADGSGNNYGVLNSVNRIEVYTDANGRAQVTLVKGQRVKVFLEGTTFQREFVVPTTDFDILTLATTKPDPFSIQVAMPMPIRS